MEKTERKGTRVALTVTAVLSLLLILSLSAVVIFKDQGVFLILFAVFYVLVPGFALLITIDPDAYVRFKSRLCFCRFMQAFLLSSSSTIS